MDGYTLGRLVRTLRHRARLTQQQLADRCGIKRWKIVKLEAGDIATLRFGDVSQCLGALDARLDIRAWYHGAAGERVMDELHSLLVGAMVKLLRDLGWEVRVEVSFSTYRERGSIDILAWHPPTRALAVGEIKSELGSIEGTLRPFDVKFRLARSIARERFGWQPLVIGRVLVLPEDRTARRAVDRHSLVLDAALPERSRALRTWLGDPVGDIAGIWFMTDVRHLNGMRNPSAIRRVRRPRPRSGQAA